MKVVSLVTDGSKAASWLATEDCQLVGLHGADSFVLSDNPSFTYPDFGNANGIVEDSFLVLFPFFGLGVETPARANLNFPIQRDKRLFVSCASSNVVVQLFIEPIG